MRTPNTNIHFHFRSRKQHRFWAAWMLILTLFINLLAAPALVLADDSVIIISTAEDLKKLAENCVYDAYSKGKKVVINNDIDLQGEAIRPIAVFSGELEGNNHTISNFVLEEKGSEKGFIIRLGEGAVVRSLILSGEINVVPDKNAGAGLKSTLSNLAKTFGLKYEDDTETTNNTGGIVATNYGSVIGCVFHGKITAESVVGGIVGENRSSGVVDYCTNDAQIFGNSQVGGIAGSNAGRIESTQNYGSVNENISASYIECGGIAGKNTGLIRGCINGGKIGTTNIGNNIGGIAGKQKGRITACSNYGEVKGRKNVGGIAGRFEPFTDIDLSAEGINNLFQAGEDAIRGTKEKIEENADRITGKTSDILDDIHTVTGDLADAASSLKSGGKIGDLKSGILDVTDSMTRLTDRLGGEELDRVNETLDEFRDSTGNISDALDRLGGAADAIVGASQGIDDLATSLSENMDSSVEDVRTRLDDLKLRIDDLDRLENDYLVPLQDDLTDIHDEILKLSRSLRRDVSDVSDALTAPLERVDDALRDVSERIQKMRDAIQTLREKFEDLKNKIDNLKPSPGQKPNQGSSAVGKILDIFSLKAYAQEEEKKVISIEAPLYRTVAGEWVDMAVIDQCYNEGTIDGGSYVGGIAGNVGVESSVKEGENLDVTEPKLVDLKGYVKATIRDCITEQKVTAKSGYAGGIAGNATLGWIYASLGAGEITVTDGEYAGGIVGSTEGGIIRCVSIPDLEAKNYIGGIAGMGKDVSECYSLPRYTTDSEHNGAIAGMITGTVENNYFIREGLPGIDGADFEAAAVAVSPMDMVGTDQLPTAYAGFTGENWVMGSDDIYLPQIASLAKADNAHNGSLLQGKSADMARFHFRVSFYEDDRRLALYTVDYDTVLAKDMIPVLESRDGYYPQWDKDVNQPIRRNTVFHADYQDATTTIATGENPPMMLVEGNFTENTTLTATVIDWVHSFGYRYKRLSGYTFQISPEYRGKIRVHIRDDSQKGNYIGIFRDGKNEILECERDGNYLIFDLDVQRDFVVLQQKPGIWYFVLWLCICGLVVLAVFLGLRLLKKKNLLPQWEDYKKHWKTKAEKLPLNEDTGQYVFDEREPDKTLPEYEELSEKTEEDAKI